MSINAGDSGCTTGLSNSIYTYLKSAPNNAFVSPLTTGADNALKALAWGVAQGVRDAVNASSSLVVARYNVSGAGTSVPTGTFTTVNFGNRVEDPNNTVTTGASWHFTAPSAGRYVVVASCVIGAQTTGASYLSIFVNGTEVQRGSVDDAVSTSGDNYRSSAVNGLVTLVAGDQMNARIFQSSGGTLGTTGFGPDGFIQIVRIGD